MRPRFKVSLILSGVPPCSQSASVRLGKPLEPRASEPWHCEQLFMNRRSPMAWACGSLATNSGAMAVNLAYRGASAKLAFFTSASYWPTAVQPSWPVDLPRPGYSAR